MDRLAVVWEAATDMEEAPPPNAEEKSEENGLPFPTAKAEEKSEENGPLPWTPNFRFINLLGTADVGTEGVSL